MHGVFTPAPLEIKLWFVLLLVEGGRLVAEP